MTTINKKEPMGNNNIVSPASILSDNKEGVALLEALRNESSDVSIQCHFGHRIRRMYYVEVTDSWMVTEERCPLPAGARAESLGVMDFTTALRCLLE